MVSKATAAAEASAVFSCFEMLSVASEVATVAMDELMQGKGFTQIVPVMITGALNPAILLEVQNSEDHKKLMEECPA